MTIGRKDKRRLKSVFNEGLTPDWQTPGEMFFRVNGKTYKREKLLTIVRTKPHEVEKLILSLHDVEASKGSGEAIFFRRRPLKPIVYCPRNMVKS